MRAKMRIASIVKNGDQEVLNMTAVSKSEGYPEDGADENNTYAKWTPTASLSLNIANPDLIGTFKENEEYYLDFTKAEG